MLRGSITMMGAAAARAKRGRTGSVSPSYALSTFTTNDWDFTADNVDDATDTLTVYGTNGSVMAGASVVFTSEDTFVDAATCTLATDVAEIEPTTGLANITAYVLNAAGTPLPGIPAASLSLASTGTGNTITAVDTVTDRNGRFRWTFESTVSEAKTLTLTAIGIAVTDTAAVTVTSTPSLPVMVFFSDWSTATGTGTSAKGDGGKWTTIGDSANGLEVVAATGLGGFSSTNVLQVTAMEANAGTQRLAVTGLGTLADGDSRWIRVEMRVDQPFLTDQSQHPIESGQTGGFAWVINSVVDADDGQWWLNIQNTGATFFWQQHWRCPKLDKGVVYRVELQVERVTSTTFRYHARVYDNAGVLLYDDSDFTNAFGSDGVSAGQYSFADNTILPAGNLSQIDEARAGLNGLSNSDWFPSVLYGYQACYAISDETWCGAYDPVNG